MAGALSGGGGGKGGSGSSGGVFPGQQALAQFTFGQNALANAQSFGAKGMGHSTGQTMADAGAYMGEALQLQQMSQADAAAQANYQNQQKAALTGLGSSAIGGLGSSLGGGSGGSLAGG